MKKIITKGLIFIIIGFIIGNYIFGEKRNIINNLKKEETYYFLQEGVYSDKINIDDNLIKLKEKVVDHYDDKYYIYIGITKDIKVVEKLTNIYKNNGIKIYVKEKNINSEEFSSNVEQFDLLINSTTDEDQIIKIEEVVLANYEEIIKK